MENERLTTSKISQRRIAIQIAVACRLLPEAIALKAAEYLLMQCIVEKAKNERLILHPKHGKSGTPPTTRGILPRDEHWDNWNWFFDDED